jgi:hypothetical protein
MAVAAIAAAANARRLLPSSLKENEGKTELLFLLVHS